MTFLTFSFFREIQAATGEWIHDYLNRGLKKNKNGNARLFVPFTAEVKKNIKRSWTISSKKFKPQIIVTHLTWQK